MGIAIEASYIYCCVWPVGVTVAAVVYVILNMVFPYRYEPIGAVVEREEESEKIDEVDMSYPGIVDEKKY